jgi:hypothetical protein
MMLNATFNHFSVKSKVHANEIFIITGFSVKVEFCQSLSNIFHCFSFPVEDPNMSLYQCIL